jgi:hypothetical protein
MRGIGHPEAAGPMSGSVQWQASPAQPLDTSPRHVGPVPHPGEDEMRAIPDIGWSENVADL